MAVGKRGIVFTLMAIIIVAFLITSEQALRPQVSSLEQDTQVAQTRTSLMHAYSRTFEQHAGQSLRTAGYFALDNMSEKVLRDGAFIADINDTFDDCVIDNAISYGGVSMNCLSGEYRLNESIDRLVELASAELGISTTYDLHGAWLMDADHLGVQMMLNLSFQIADSFASWSIENRIVNVTVDVSGIEDPLYAYLRSVSKTTERREFGRSPYKILQFNDSVFMQHYVSGSYLAYPSRAPSVLQRYMGGVTATSTCCGVESIIDRSSLINSEDRYVNYSMTDHQFVAHLTGRLDMFNCTEWDVLGKDIAGDTLILDMGRFNNVYNLTRDVGQCAWP